MTTIHTDSPSRGPQDTVRGEARTSSGGARYIPSEPLGPQGGGTSGAWGPTGPQFGVPAGRRANPAPLFRIPRRSVALAGLLALVLGPLGMVYGTIFGAFVTAVVVFWTAILNPHAVAAVWLVGVAWAMWGAYRRNRRAAYVEARFGL